MNIRKISVGGDYKNSMHYVHGQQVLDGSYTIDLIQYTEGSYRIWISNGNEIMLWKEFNSSMPISIEYNINF